MNHSTDQADAATDTGLPVVPVPRSANSAERDPLKRQEALVAMGRRAVAPPEPMLLLRDAAAMLAEMLDADYFSVAEISPQDGSLSLRLATVESEAAETQESTTPIDREDPNSLTAHVLQAAHPVLVDDLLEDERFRDPVLGPYKFRSAIVVPLLVHKTLYGVLGAYSMESHRFDEEDLLFVETIAHLATTTVACKQAEKALATERLRNAQVLQTMDTMVLTLDSQWRIIDANRACEGITGFALPELKKRSIWSVFPVAQDDGVVAQLREDLKQGATPIQYESDLLTKHSERIRVAWSYSAITAENGALESIIATGVDVTESREARARVERAEKAAAKARQAIGDYVVGAGNASGQGGGEQGAAGGEFSRLPLPPNAERRGRPRRSYQYRQRVAAVVEGELPKLTDFKEVLCNDISAGGFSFLAESAPASDTLVVALGIFPKVKYVTAQIAHITRVERDGKRMFLVGCNYTGRLRY